MKSKIFFVLLLVTFFGCSKDESKSDKLKFIETIPGGCAVSNMKAINSVFIEEDTVTYSVSNGELHIIVGFNATCCGSYNTSFAVENDTIFLNIKTSQIGLCNCICYYTYDFMYEGMYRNYRYVVNVDDFLFFKGLISP